MMTNADEPSTFVPTRKLFKLLIIGDPSDISFLIPVCWLCFPFLWTRLTEIFSNVDEIQQSYARIIPTYRSRYRSSMENLLLRGNK